MVKAPFKIGYIDTVHGICPHCQEDTLLVAVVTVKDDPAITPMHTLLVAVVTDYYKCTHCGEETRQYVNGSIKYLKLNDNDREWLKENQSSE